MSEPEFMNPKEMTTFQLRCEVEYWRDKANHSRVSPGASGCSHGGEQRMEIPARSHDRALDEERREFWKACFVQLLRHTKTETWEDANNADDCLEEFDKRFGDKSNG